MPFPPMDMVFTYVDGTDPAHIARRAAMRGALAGNPAAGAPPKERDIWYRGVGEITFGVRSVLRFMPWIRTIHIVTDSQVPPVDRDLVASGKVRIVNHRDFIPEPYLPTFASTIIESFLHRIPGLSDIYLYNNDDFFHASPITPDEFAERTSDGDWRLHLRTVAGLGRAAIRAASDWSPSFLPRANAYTSGIANSASLLRSRWGLPWRHIVFPRHVTQVYRIATALALEEALAEDLHLARLRHFRSPAQLSWSTLAYSAECHWHAARQRPFRLFRPGLRQDELLIDFGLLRSPRRIAAAWQEVAHTSAKFICLNNIPAAQHAAYHAAMERCGL